MRASRSAAVLRPRGLALAGQARSSNPGGAWPPECIGPSSHPPRNFGDGARARVARLTLFASLALLGRCGGGGSPAVDGLVRITTAALPAAATGAEFAATVEAVGPHVPIAWRLVGGMLPPGLALDGETGAIAGFPRAEGRFRFEVEARDGVDSRLSRDVVFAADRRRFDLDVVRGAVAVLPFPVAVAQFAAPFVHRFEAAGGVGPHRFALSGGALPAGLSLAPDGLLVGVALSAMGPFRPRVRATDAAGASAEREFDVTVAVLPLGIDATAFADAAMGFAYDKTPLIRPAGGGPPYAWSVAPDAGALPPGIALDPESGRLYGTPTAVGLFAFRLALTDLAGQVVSRDVAILVNPGPVLEDVMPATLPKTGAPVVLAGQAFQPGMRVQFGVAPWVVATVELATRATVVAPTAPLQSGPVDVRVENPDGGAYTLHAGFRYPLAIVEFAAQGAKSPTTAPGSSRGIAAGDFDGDGRAEVVAVWSNGITITKSTGLAYTNAWTVTTLRSSGSYNDVAVADVDADGDLDFVALRSSTTETIEVYKNDGQGGFPSTASATTTYSKPASYFPSSIAAGDVDGDGVADVAFTSGSGGQGTVWVARGLGTGQFTVVHTATDSVFDATAGCFAPNEVALGDLDGDGRDDLVVVDAFPNACATGVSCPATNGVANAHPGADDLVAWVARSGPGGVPGPWSGVRVSSAFGRLNGDNLGVAIYDHDGDGKKDAAVFGGYQDLRGMGVAFLSGDGHGVLAERYVRPTAYNRRYGARIDANLDGCDDLVVVGGDGRAGSFGAQGYSVAEVYLGGIAQAPLRAWTSGAETSSSIPGANPGRVVVADFDGDGLLDFAVDQSFNTKERFSNDQDDGPVEGVSVYLNRSH